MSNVWADDVMAKDKLPDLPSTEDKDFWGGYTEIIEMHEKDRCTHGGNLTHRDNYAYCINCNAMWKLDVYDKIIDGHLYRKSVKVI